MPVASILGFERPSVPPDRGEQIALLRQALVDKFPEPPARKGGILPTGLAAIDQAEGGLRLGSVTELTGRPGGNSLALAALLATLGRERRLGALVDCGKFFDPGSFQGTSLRRLLWVRCETAAEAVKAADLLLRDGNLSLLALDLQGTDPRGIKRIPGSTWHRFGRVAEQGSVALAVFSSHPIVEGASVRISLDWQWDFKAITDRRSKLTKCLQAKVIPRRRLIMPETFNLQTA